MNLEKLLSQHGVPSVQIETDEFLEVGFAYTENLLNRNILISYSMYNLEAMENAGKIEKIDTWVRLPEYEEPDKKEIIKTWLKVMIMGKTRSHHFFLYTWPYETTDALTLSRKIIDLVHFIEHCDDDSILGDLSDISRQEYSSNMADTPRLQKEAYKEDQRVFKEILVHIEHQRVNAGPNKLQNVMLTL